MRISMKSLMVTAVLVSGLTLVSGCQKGTPTTCPGWEKLLSSPVNGKKAIQRLGELQCDSAIPKLEESFSRSRYKENILDAIAQINKPALSISLINNALRDPEAAVRAASVVKEFANRPAEAGFDAKVFRPALIEILTTNKALDARMNALEALAAIDRDNLMQDEEICMKLVLEDPNLQKIEVNAYAATLLGQMKSVNGIPALIKAVFIRDQRGRQAYAPVRKALATIGEPAVEPIIGVMTRDAAKYATLIEEIDALAAKMGVFDWQIYDGPELVQILGDLRDVRGALPLAKDLGSVLTPPVGVDDRVIRTWQMAQQNRITMSMTGLWNIGTPEIIPTLVETIVNPENDAKQRLDTASSLSLIANYAGVPALLKIYKETQMATFRAPLVKVLSLGVDWDNYAAFKKLLAAERADLVTERFTGDGDEALAFKANVRVLEECQKNDVECLVKMMNDANVVTAQKASVLMGNLTDPAARATALAALLEKYPQIDPRRDVDFRRFVLLSIWRLGDKSIVKDIERLLAADKANRGASYWVDELEVFLPAIATR